MKQHGLSKKLEERFPSSAHPLSGAGGRDRHPDEAGVARARSILCHFCFNRSRTEAAPFPSVTITAGGTHDRVKARVGFLKIQRDGHQSGHFAASQ